MTFIQSKSSRLQGGMTLVEVLVTLVLISVGLLGLAALQLTSLKSNQESLARTQASILAGTILDCMRANSNAARTGAYTVAADGTGVAGTVAGQDLTAWQGQIDQLLPGGAANATGTTQVLNGIATITIQWSERADRATGQIAGPATFQTRSEI